MLSYTLRRLLTTIPVLFGVATLVFALLHLVPGDPAVSMLGEGASVADVQALRTKLGLDRPLVSQYRSYLTGLLQGDLGTSFLLRAPVSKEIGKRVTATLSLAMAAMAIAVVLALPLGIIGAVYKGRAPDQVAMTLAVIGLSLPAFWLGPMLALVFAVELGWFPVSGRGSLAHIVLPALALGLALAALLARMTRTTLLDELHELYVLAARGRGLSR